MKHLASLSNEQLEQSLIAEAGDKRQLTARVIERLAEVIRRDWHLERGFASVTEYCVEVLGYTLDQCCRHSQRMPRVPQTPSTPNHYGFEQQRDSGSSAPHLEHAGRGITRSIRSAQRPVCVALDAILQNR